MSSLLQYLPEDYILRVLEFPLGAPYAYGGKNGPAVMPFSIISGKTDVRGYDCSGYAQICLRILGAIGHGVPWMSAQSMYDAATKVSTPQIGDCAFYSANGGSSICHVTMVVDTDTIIGANSGGSSTFADDPDAMVKYGDGYWSSGFVSYGTFRGGYGLDMDDWVTSFALYIATMKGYQGPSDFPSGVKGWEMFNDILQGKLDGNYGHTGLDLYETYMALNDGVSLWDSVVDTLTGVAGAAYATVSDWIDGSGDGSDEVAEEEEPEGDPSWLEEAYADASDWLFGDDEAEVKAEAKEGDEEAASEEDWWPLW